MATRDTIVDIAPEFSNLDPARIDRFISYAQPQVNENVFGDKYDLALAYLTAHMLALANRNDTEGTNGTAGNITAKKEGDLALNFGLPLSFNNNKDGTLMLTSYGIEFMRIRDLCVIGPRTFYEC